MDTGKIRGLIHTLDGLLSEEIMFHGLDVRRQPGFFCMFDHLGKILEYEASWCVRPLALEFR